MRFLKTTAIVVLSVVTLSGCTLLPADKTTEAQPIEPTPTELAAIPSPAPVEYTLTATQSGQTALELSLSALQIDVQEFDYGVFVQSINGMPADSAHFWALYHNGAQAVTGAADLELQQDDTITWKFEEIKNGL